MLIPDPKTARIGEELLPFDIGYLPELYQKKAEVELHETPEKIIQCTKQLRELAKSDDLLKDTDFNDEILVQYLRMRKYDVDRALATLHDAAKFVRKYPENFCNFKFEETVKAMTQNIITFLPWRCQDGCTLLLVELDKWKLDNFSVRETKQMIVVVLFQALQMHPMTQVNGFKVIFDVKMTSLRLIKVLTPQNMWMLYHGTQECIPGRFKGIHIVNDSIVFKTAWLIIKHFFSEKLKKRIRFHSSPKGLLDHFPKSVLPISYAGELEDYQKGQITWLKKAMAPEMLDQMGGGLLKNLEKLC
ncbi:hypothetical protein JTE90_004952 [Oedothorax gibbosus]|uniref:CRAL-TRIO domain-containing protein n=1 Tax=Oedothorax gibbosus TaxID=931172 RepID=A0AAV6VBU8_9ARAC|nr:hypothetical protein JTE90_004952 [Oedothorax gibbosus]